MKWLPGTALLSAAILVVSGCGPRTAEPDADPVAVVDGTATPAAPGEDATAAPATEGAPAVQGSPGSTVPPGSDAPEPPEPSASPDYGPEHNNGTVTIELSATCVRPGDLLVVTFRTPPKAGLGMIIGFSDGRPHGAMLTGESDANGMYVWRVPIEPTVPEGQAKVLVTATGANWEREGGGTADAVFQVARGGC